MTLQEALNLAGQKLREGQWIEAEAIYRQVLAAQPDSPPALQGMARVLQRGGRLDDAARCLDRALALRPDDGGLLNDRANLFAERGDLDSAIALFQRAISLRPDLPQLYHNCASALQKRGRLDEAISAYRQAIALRPDLAESLCNLGNALQDKGEVEEAIDCYRRAVAARPDFAEAHNNLGNALAGLGEFDQAYAAFNRAIALVPNRFEVLVNFGSALRKGGRIDDAITCLTQAVALHPRDGAILVALASMLFSRMRMDEAAAAYSQAIALDPNNAEAHNDLGVVRLKQGRFPEAEAAFSRALALRPDNAEIHANLAAVMQANGRLSDAIAYYDRSLALAPNAIVASNRLLAIQLHPDFDAPAVLREHRQWNDAYAKTLRHALPPLENDRSPDRRLRIGYLSGDFRQHQVGWNLLPLLANHDHENFEIFAFAAVARPDSLTEKLKSHCDAWRSILTLDDQAAAELIRTNGIDILIDLAGHTNRNRILIFARKPAPVQASWLGYAGTTGLEAMDYRISDPFLDPPDSDVSCYSEQTVRLPHTFWCYQPGGTAPEIAPPRAAGAAVTFGCLTNFSKVAPAALELWAKVMGEISSSRLLLNCPDGPPRENIRRRLSELGISADRVEFVARQPWEGYMATYRRIDILLDPLPYGGGVTTCDALWMGVPVVTLRGQTTQGRGGASILGNLGLPELVAANAEHYVRIAVELAKDDARRAELRGTLRKRMADSPLMNAGEFARDMENLYRDIWRRFVTAG
ncbi:MAG: tetratricopeptide repeat protein [Tepidisphaeraceae bacterium]|jgi:predicted O-linked N-acetylglucosamine transferase (SPINDLY family)